MRASGSSTGADAGQPARLRAARPEEAALLSALALESKAHWGYGRDLLDRWAADLAISRADIDRHATVVAEDAPGIVGFYQLRADSGFWSLEHLWVRPAHHRRGIGSSLLKHALRAARASAQPRVVVTADPHAAGFYEREGGVGAGFMDAPLPGDPDRRLPRYEFPGPGAGRTTWRAAVAQVHLWIGLVLAIYLLVLSLSGSLIVLRPQFHRWLAPSPIAIAAVPGAESPQGLLQRASPAILQSVEWLVKLHDDLLAGHRGRITNGVGGLLLAVLVITGLVVWSTSRSRWRGVTSTGPPAKSVVFARRLHVALGFWISALVLVWAVTAVYFAFPEPFDGLIDGLDPDPDDDVRPGESVLEGMVKLHFGRLGGYAGRAAWMVLGLLPAVLAVTGAMMWFSRRRRSAARRR